VILSRVKNPCIEGFEKAEDVNGYAPGGKGNKKKLKGGHKTIRAEKASLLSRKRKPLAERSC